MPRIEARDGIEVETEPIHHARAEVVHHDVGARDQRLHPLQVARRFQVGGEALLVAVDGVEERAVGAESLVRELQLAGEVAAAGALHLDDLGAEIGEPQAAGRSRQELAEVEYQHSLERTFPTSRCCWPACATVNPAPRV